MIRELSFTAYLLKITFLLVITSVPVYGFKYHIPLRINMLHVPTPVVAGDSILLKCEYELGNETLYAVKWYKNMGEFYRYVPASDPPLKTFPQAGIDVDGGITSIAIDRWIATTCWGDYPEDFSS
ncbi:uncharacterized protein TNCV_809131 [Trichonephila clavipes]|nr:uncharacterized protein TNCV_809131 [Trichonephila clavipes]